MAGSTKIVKRELADQINELLELIESGNVGGGNSKLQVHTQDLIVGVAGQTEFPITLETFDPAIDTVIVQKGMLLLNPKGDYTISDKKVVLTEPVVDGQTIGIWVWQNVPRTEGESYISGALLTDGSISMDKIDAAFAAELDEVKKSVSDGKAAVANAITNKGVETATDATFETMATNINSIVTLDSAPGLEAATWTPGTSNQVIAAGNYLKGDQTIAGDANLVAGNIAKGKSIFGVSGTYDPTASGSIYGWVYDTVMESDTDWEEVDSDRYSGTVTITLPYKLHTILLTDAFDDGDYEASILSWVPGYGYNTYGAEYILPLITRSGTDVTKHTSFTLQVDDQAYTSPDDGYMKLTLNSTKTKLTIQLYKYYASSWGYLPHKLSGLYFK